MQASPGAAIGGHSIVEARTPPSAGPIAEGRTCPTGPDWAWGLPLIVLNMVIHPIVFRPRGAQRAAHTGTGPQRRKRRRTTTDPTGTRRRPTIRTLTRTKNLARNPGDLRMIADAPRWLRAAERDGGRAVGRRRSKARSDCERLGKSRGSNRSASTTPRGATRRGRPSGLAPPAEALLDQRHSASVICLHNEDRLADTAVEWFRSTCCVPARYDPPRVLQQIKII